MLSIVAGTMLFDDKTFKRRVLLVILCDVCLCEAVLCRRIMIQSI